MLNNIKYYILRFLEKVCKYFNILIVIPTKVGVKTLNAASFRSDQGQEESGECYYSKGFDLFLGPDFLKDEYTLLDCPLSESPHLGFVKCLSYGKSPKSTDYIKRFYAGTLDGRVGHRTISNFSVFVEKNKSHREEILAGKVAPVKVYEWKGRKYIQDGKHRAALCVLLNKEIPYELIDGKLLFGGVTACMMRVAAEKKHEYSKHILFFEK